MSYGHRVVAILVVFFAVVFTANGYLIHVANTWAADDMKVGKGHSKFPPQVTTKGAK